MPLQRCFKFFLLCFTSMLMLPCAAQEKEMIRVQFVSFPMITGEKPIELLTGDGQAIPIQLPSNSLSDAYNIVKPRVWVLGETIVNEEGKPRFNPFGKADMLDAPHQLILVTRKGATNADGFNMVPLAMNDQGFGKGKYIFFNASKVEIACEVGDKKFAIKPKRFNLIAPKPNVVKNERGYLYTTLYYNLNGKAKAFYTSTWRFNEKARCMVFIYHDPHTKQLRTHSIRSFLF